MNNSSITAPPMTRNNMRPTVQEQLTLYRTLQDRATALRANISHLNQRISNDQRTLQNLSGAASAEAGQYIRIMNRDNIRERDKLQVELDNTLKEIRNIQRSSMVVVRQPDDDVSIALPIGMPYTLPNNPSGSGLYSKYKRRRQI